MGRRALQQDAGIVAEAHAPGWIVSQERSELAI